MIHPRSMISPVAPPIHGGCTATPAGFRKPSAPRPGGGFPVGALLPGRGPSQRLALQALARVHARVTAP